MSLLEKMRKDKMQSMREKDKLKTGTISSMMSSIALAEKEHKGELTDEEALTYVQKELKQARDSLEMTPDYRPDLIEETTRRIAIIESYLPKQLTEEELVAEIQKILAEKNLEPSPKIKGMLIKETLSRFQGRTDGKAVNQAVAKFLKK